MRIPDGNLAQAACFPWVSLRSTHGYKSDHPHWGWQRRHARQTRGRPSSRPYTACTNNSTQCLIAHARPAETRATFQSPLHCMYVQFNAL
ncbi:MAG: hypothetical protein K2G49_09905 [Muribaculum sp.]|nr:hypothetical protein [Muribaculum sp.]